MRTYKILFLLDGKKQTRTAVLTDDLDHPVPHPDNQATGVIDGVAEELGIWSIYFDNNEIEADFVCEIDDDGNEMKTVTPVEIWLWDEEHDGRTIQFMVVEI